MHAPLRLLAVLLFAALTTGCATTRTTVTTTEAQCAPWRRIQFSAQGDTPQTIRDVRVHNAVGRKLSCWK